MKNRFVTSDQSQNILVESNLSWQRVQQSKYPWQAKRWNDVFFRAKLLGQATHKLDARHIIFLVSQFKLVFWDPA